MRGTTVALVVSLLNRKISTHVPHAGHDKMLERYVRQYIISTHVPHAGHDCICWVSSLLKFNIL